MRTEHQEQVSFFQRARKLLLGTEPQAIDLLFSIPNGGRRDSRTAASMKMEGLKPGVPDILFACPSGQYHGLFIEMKREKGGTLSAPQKRIISSLRSAGYRVEVCRGCDEAMKIFSEYMDSAP